MRLGQLGGQERPQAGAERGRVDVADQGVLEHEAGQEADIVVGPDGTTVLTASAASPLVAQLLQQAAAAIPAGGPGAPEPATGAAPATPSGQDPSPSGAGSPGAAPVRVLDVVAAL